MDMRVCGDEYNLLLFMAKCRSMWEFLGMQFSSKVKNKFKEELIYITKDMTSRPTLKILMRNFLMPKRMRNITV